MVRFIGDTEFSKGEVVYGVELATPEGKHDGTVGNMEYFSCEPGHGTFAKRKHLKLLPPDVNDDDSDKRREEDAAAAAAREEARRRRDAERQVRLPMTSRPGLVCVDMQSIGASTPP